MATDSILYLLLLSVAFLLCWFSHLKYRAGILVFFSLAFLIFQNPNSSIFFLLSMGLNWWTLAHYPKNKSINSLLIFANIFSLLLIKYIFPHAFSSSLGYTIPLGISIFIFQQISFIIDSRFSPLNFKFKEYFTYSLFFGNITTGPIANASAYYQQRSHFFIFRSENLYLGIIYILSGYFKKVVVADNLSIVTSTLFQKSISDHQNLIIPFLINKYEIYANFSGFSDIAIGSAILFGISLPQNFNRPFATSSIVDFWKRWHISLTSWIKEYVFLPLTISRFNKIGPYSIMAITFIIFALWHGFSSNHLLYGLLQVALVYGSYKLSFINTFITNRGFLFQIIFRGLKWIWFYVVLISIPGILFRVDSIEQFQNIINRVLQGLVISPQFDKAVIFALISVLCMELLEKMFSPEKACKFIRKKTIGFRTLVFLIFLFVYAFLCNNESTTVFIYSKY